LKLDRIRISDTLQLTEIRPSDADTFVRHLGRDRSIYEFTLQIPFPYTKKDAEFWIGLNQELSAEGKIHNWAIRDEREEAMGGIGFNTELDGAHKAEIGYWLAKPYWGRGIMTTVLKRFVRIGFDDLVLKRLQATVFHHNGASARVLEKAGFQCEGTLRNYYRKDGKVFDAKLYALVP
jgi:RimJ/RimL family protein N-acetyltransferase